MSSTESMELTLGDPVLDRDHAELLRLIQHLREIPLTEAVPALDALIAHAAGHFEVEDADLRRLHDPNATCHLDEHAAVLKSLAEVRQFLRQASPDAARSQDVLGRLTVELTRWLPEHVQFMDAAVANLRTRERLGGAPVLIARKPAVPAKPQ